MDEIKEKELKRRLGTERQRMRVEKVLLTLYLLIHVM